MMPWLAYALLGASLAALAWFVREKSRRRTHPVTGGLDETVFIPHSAEVELYSNAFSHCSRKTRLALAELGIEARHHSIDLIETGWYQTLSPDYLEINPSGMVPTLIHNGSPVYESDDILLYAQTIAGPDAPQLVPTDPELLAELKHWLDFCAISSVDAMDGIRERAGACVPALTLPIFVTSIQHIPLRNILVGFLFHFDKKRPALFTASKLFGLRFMMQRPQLTTMMHGSRDAMRHHLVRLNDALASDGKPWILGDSYSLADITLACLLLRLEETGWLGWFERAETIGEVSRYYERLKARDSWSAAITAHAHPIVAQAQEDLRQAVEADPDLRESIYGSCPEPNRRARGVGSVVMLQACDIQTKEVLEWKGLHLFHFSGSTCSQKTRIFLRLKGIPWTGHHLDLPRKQHLKPFYMGLNPRGLVPALVHDGKVIIESNDILEYLEAEYPEPPLIPPGDEDRVSALLEAEDNLHLDIRALTMRFVFPTLMTKRPEKDIATYAASGTGTVEGKPDPHRDVETEFWRDMNEHGGISDAKAKRAFGRFKAALAQLELRLARHDHLAGDALTVVDVAWYIYSRRLLEAGYPLTRLHPLVGAWFDRMHAKPEFREEVPSGGLPGLVTALLHAVQRLKGSTLVDVVARTKGESS